MQSIRNLLMSGVLFLAIFSLSYAQDATLQVLPDANSGVYWLTYLGGDTDQVIVKVEDEQGTLLHREVLSAAQTQGRAYRLTDLPSGEYTFLVKGAEAWTAQSVSYPIQAETASLELDVLTDPKQNRVQLQLEAAPEQVVTVRIYDEDARLLYQKEGTAAEQTAQIFNLEQVYSQSVIVSVSDEYQTVEQTVKLR